MIFQCCGTDRSTLGKTTTFIYNIIVHYTNVYKTHILLSCMHGGVDLHDVYICSLIN